MIRLFGAIQGLKTQAQGLLLGLGTGGNAGVGDVVSGKTFTNDLGQQTGTATIASLGGANYSTGSGTINASLQAVVSGLSFTPKTIEIVVTLSVNNSVKYVYTLSDSSIIDTNGHNLNSFYISIQTNGANGVTGGQLNNTWTVSAGTFTLSGMLSAVNGQAFTWKAFDN